MLYYLIVDLKIFFRAKIVLVALCLQIWTSPNFPEPTHFPNWNYLISRGDILYFWGCEVANCNLMGLSFSNMDFDLWMALLIGSRSVAEFSENFFAIVLCSQFSYRNGEHSYWLVLSMILEKDWLLFWYLLEEP